MVSFTNSSILVGAVVLTGVSAISIEDQSGSVNVGLPNSTPRRYNIVENLNDFVVEIRESADGQHLESRVPDQIRDVQPGLPIHVVLEGGLKVIAKYVDTHWEYRLDGITNKLRMNDLKRLQPALWKKMPKPWFCFWWRKNNAEWVVKRIFTFVTEARARMVQGGSAQNLTLRQCLAEVMGVNGPTAEEEHFQERLQNLQRMRAVAEKNRQREAQRVLAQQILARKRVIRLLQRLLEVVKDGNVVEVRKLVLKYPKIVNHRYGSGKLTVLMVAAHLGLTEVVQVLLQANASAELKNSQGSTALDIATRHGKDAVVAVLSNAH